MTETAHPNRVGRKLREGGFTLVELMIVISIIAILAAVGVPKLVSSRVVANEAAAIATLRTISTCQAQLMSAVAMDTNGDGGGEHGYFGELSGLTPLRQWSLAGPVVGAADQRLESPALGVTFRDIVSDGTDGVVESQGYFFKMFLPDDAISRPIGAVAEAPTGGSRAGSLPGSSNAEIYWCCYAWPVHHAKTGIRAFMVNQAGDIVATPNTSGQSGGPYESFDRIPEFDAAFTVASDMGSNPAIPAGGLPAQDGLIWTNVGN